MPSVLRYRSCTRDGWTSSAVARWYCARWSRRPASTRSPRASTTSWTGSRSASADVVLRFGLRLLLVVVLDRLGRRFVAGDRLERHLRAGLRDQLGEHDAGRGEC